MEKKAKRLVALLSATLVACMGSSIAMAADADVIEIDSSAKLVEAIKNQEDGQTWVLKAGNYDVADDCLEVEANINGVPTGFVFPIFVDDLTIRGEGDVTVTSTYDTNTGNWNGQNFITISGQNVTIENVDLKGNPNSFYDGQCNKVIELIGDAKDFTLKDAELLPIDDPDGKQNSGSIYVNVADAGATVLENVTMYSWVNAKAVTTGMVTAKNLVQDFTNNTNAGYYSEDYGYGWNPGVSGEKVALEGFTIKVDGESNFVQQIVKNLKSGTTVELMSDIEVDEGVYIHTPDVAIVGNGHTITAAEGFKMNTEGQINLMKIQADDVVVENVKLVATADNKHTLDIWGADNVTLKDVTLDHKNGKTGAPLIVNSSNVTVSGAFDVVTGANSWYGINADDKNGPVSITFADDVAVTYTDDSGKDLPLVFLELTDETKPEDVIKNPENAGLILGEDGQFEEHTHAYGEEWKSDETNHWHECTCGAKGDLAAHESDEGVVTKEATEKEAGVKTYSCKTCGRVLKTEEIPATGEKPVTGESTLLVIPMACLLLAAAGMTVSLAFGKKKAARHAK